MTPASRKKRDETEATKANIRAYLASMPPKTRKVLKEMREIVRETVPEATENFSYRMPGFKLDGKALVWYAGFTEHVSLFPITGAIQRAHATALARYGTSKGTVRFLLTEPPPVALMKKLVKARVAEVRKAKR